MTDSCRPLTSSVLEECTLVGEGEMYPSDGFTCSRERSRKEVGRASDVPMDPHENVPLACSLTVGELRVRGEDNASLFAHARDVQELPDGSPSAFPAGADAEPARIR